MKERAVLLVLGSAMSVGLLVLSLYMALIALAFYVISGQASTQPVTVPFVVALLVWPLLVIAGTITGYVAVAKERWVLATRAFFVPLAWGLVVLLTGILAGASFPVPAV